MGAVSQLWSLGAELRFDPTCSTWGTFQSQFHTVDKTCWSIFLHKEHRRTQKQVNFCSMASMGLSELLLFSALYAEVWPSASVQVTLRGAPRTLTNCDRCSLENRHPARQSLLICLRLLGRNFDLLIYATCRASKASPSHLPTAGSYLESRNSFMVSGRNKLLCRKRATAQTFKYRMYMRNHVNSFTSVMRAFAKCNWVWSTHNMYLCIYKYIYDVPTLYIYAYDIRTVYVSESYMYMYAHTRSHIRIAVSKLCMQGNSSSLTTRIPTVAYHCDNHLQNMDCWSLDP